MSKSAEVVVPVLTALLGAGVGAVLTYLSASRELDIRLVEIGVGILTSAPEKEKPAAGRSWAVDVMEKYSGVTFSASEREGLKGMALQLSPIARDRPEVCNVWRPLEWSQRDTPETVGEVKASNARRSAWCK